MVKFVPAWGISLSNLSGYADKPFINAIGGGWLCSSNFVGSAFEIMKGRGLWKNGYIAIRTNCIDRAVYCLSTRGYKVDESTLKQKNGKKIAIYLEDEVSGFAIHLLQK